MCPIWRAIRQIIYATWSSICSLFRGVLHAWIREVHACTLHGSMECFLHTSYREDFKKWQARSAWEKERVAERKAKIQGFLRDQLGLVLMMKYDSNAYSRTWIYRSSLKIPSNWIHYQILSLFFCNEIMISSCQPIWSYLARYATKFLKISRFQILRCIKILYCILRQLKCGFHNSVTV